LASSLGRISELIFGVYIEIIRCIKAIIAYDGKH
jgi:hypothetical protein